MENENTDESQTPVESTEQPDTESLDDISQEFSVDEEVNNQFTAQPNQQAYQPPVPDPVSDPYAYESYARQQEALNSQIQNTMRELDQRVRGFEQTQAQQQLDTDVNSAVQMVNETVNADPVMVEIALEKIHRTDPSFAKIWDNRAKNPAAFKKAMGVVTNKVADMFKTVSDPQLLENQRAAQSSQRTMATTPKVDPNDAWKNLSDAEFQRKWDAEKRG